MRAGTRLKGTGSDGLKFGEGVSPYLKTEFGGQAGKLLEGIKESRH